MHSVHVAIKHHVYRYLDTCADLGEGPEGSRSPFFRRVLQKIYDKNIGMIVQMLFSGPIFPELGSRPIPPSHPPPPPTHTHTHFFNLLDPPLRQQLL